MATYTSLDDIDVRAFARDYGLSDPRLEPLAGGAANSSFLVRSELGQHVLTVLDNHDMSSAVVVARLMRALVERGVPTTEVVPDARGRLVSVVGGKPAVLKRWIDGTVLDPLPDRLLPEAGKVLATLHEVPTGLPGLPSGTRRLSADQRHRIGDFADRDFSLWLTGRLARVRAEDVHRVPVVAHGDLFADNVIVRPDASLAVIDWETASLDDPLLDLGMAVVGLARTGDRLPAGRAEALIAGYTSVRPLTADELAAVPTAIEHAALIIAFHRYYRHNVRFPNPDRADSHQEIVRFVHELADFRPVPVGTGA
ncbi:homoserine kinase type II [Saccharothrix coeruleofusca]|uniref:phosphotransferase n=1 Tax=Saccharothrix coeruleofusca TaxID=33919 RepID=UPI001AE353FE|nr:phosphotransferase [Saccharothrix coeruleofusca]MBP2337199.1 homoserine kinase type II [Saccharothrix coeruleofusca]